MNEQMPVAEAPEAGAPPPSAWLRWLRSLEDGLLGFVLAALVVLPLTELVSRKLGWKGIKGSSQFILHFTLLVSVLGGAMASRAGRLLTLSSLPSQLKGRWKSGALLFSGAFSVAVSVVLAVAGWQFVQAESATGGEIAYGIPRRAFQMFLPLGFALVGLGIANVVPVLFGSAGKIGGPAAGSALAAVATPGYVGFLSGPPLIGLAAEQLGLRAALAIVCAACALIALGAGRLPGANIPSR